MAVFDREGGFILKIDRMLYGFYYFTSCQIGLLCLNWRVSAAARVKNRTLRKDSVAAAARPLLGRCWDVPQRPGGNAFIDLSGSDQQRWRDAHVPGGNERTSAELGVIWLTSVCMHGPKCQNATPSVHGELIALQTSFCDVFIANAHIAMTMKIWLIVQA